MLLSTRYEASHKTMVETSSLNISFKEAKI